MSADQRHFLFAALTLAAAVALGLIVGGSSLGRRCGHSITPTSFETPIPKLPPTAPNFEGLAYRYEPTLVVARSDRNWPTSIHTVLELQIGGRITCLHSNPACDDPESAASGFGGLLQCALSGGACAPP